MPVRILETPGHTPALYCIVVAVLCRTALHGAARHCRAAGGQCGPDVGGARPVVLLLGKVSCCVPWLPLSPPTRVVWVVDDVRCEPFPQRRRQHSCKSQLYASCCYHVWDKPAGSCEVLTYLHCSDDPASENDDDRTPTGSIQHRRQPCKSICCIMSIDASVSLTLCHDSFA